MSQLSSRRADECANPEAFRRGYTRHSQVRMQQRALPPFVVSLIIDFGSRLRNGGADVFFVDKLARRRLRVELGGDRGLAVIDQWLGAYVVVSDDGTVITTGHRTSRIKRA